MPASSGLLTCTAHLIDIAVWHALTFINTLTHNYILIGKPVCAQHMIPIHSTQDNGSQILFQ